MVSTPANERLIVALDVESAPEARALVERLGDAASFYKVGLQLAMTRDYFDLIAWLRQRGCQVFADVKLYDIPETVRLAMRQLARHDVQLATVHGDRAIMEAACSVKGSVKVMAVTVLTSMDASDLDELGYQGTIEELALRRARNAVRLGCDGVITSAMEAPRLRSELGDAPLLVVPGIRPAGGDAGDQKRVATPERAIAAGASYLVVGRPIRDAADPRQAALSIQEQIRAATGI